MNNQEQKTILLVEDETTTMMVETHLLKSFGYDVVPAKSGEEAVQIATGNDKVALVLMDINLGPGMDGTEAARQILLKRNLPVVFLSSHTEKEYVERIKGIAGYGYVVKNSGNVVLQSSIEMAFNLFDAQAAMQASKESFRMLYASSPVGIEIYDKSGRLISANSAALAIFGLASEDPAKGFDLFADPNISEDYKAMLQRGETIKYTAHFDFEKVRKLALYPTARRGIIELEVMIQPLAGGCGYQVIVQDITERKVFEQKLIELKDIINRSGSLVFIWRVEPDKWPVEFVSENVADILGYSVEDFVSGRVEWPKITHPNDVPRLEKEVAQYMEKGVRNWSQEYRLITKSGEVRWFRDDNLALENSDGKIIRIQAVIHDITARKRVEDALRESETKYKALFTGAAEGMIIVDFKASQFRHVNLALCRMFGYTEEEFIRLKLADIHPKESVERVQSEFESLMSGKNVLAEDITCLRKDGTLFYASISAVKMVIDGCECAVGLFTDITARKRTEATLRESHELLSLFIRNSPVYAYIKEVTSAQGVVLQASDNFRQMIGIPGSKMVGKTISELFPGELGKKMIADDWAVASSGNALKLDEDLNGRNYTTIKFPIVQGDKTLLAGYTIDITELKEMQEKLLVSEKLAAMGRLVADVCHELNNPLAIITGNTALLEEMVKEQVATIPDSENNMKRFEKIHKAIYRCKTIMASLLVSSRPTMLDVKPADMNKIIEESLEAMDDRFKSQNVKVVRAFAPRLPIIEADGNRLGQVFINMFRNACDAMPEGGELRIASRLHTPGKVTGKEGHAGSAANPLIKIEISDTGEGILEKDLSKIFDPFVTTKKDGKGVGLGLSISYGIVKEHGGSISVASKKGEGATFTIKIPVTAQR